MTLVAPVSGLFTIRFPVPFGEQHHTEEEFKAVAGEDVTPRIAAIAARLGLTCAARDDAARDGAAQLAALLRSHVEARVPPPPVCRSPPAAWPPARRLPPGLAHHAEGLARLKAVASSNPTLDSLCGLEARFASDLTDIRMCQAAACAELRAEQEREMEFIFTGGGNPGEVTALVAKHQVIPLLSLSSESVASWFTGALAASWPDVLPAIQHYQAEQDALDARAVAQQQTEYLAFLEALACGTEQQGPPCPAQPPRLPHLSLKSDTLDSWLQANLPLRSIPQPCPEAPLPDPSVYRINVVSLTDNPGSLGLQVSHINDVEVGDPYEASTSQGALPAPRPRRRPGLASFSVHTHPVSSTPAWGLSQAILQNSNLSAALTFVSLNDVLLPGTGVPPTKQTRIDHALAGIPAAESDSVHDQCTKPAAPANVSLSAFCASSLPQAIGQTHDFMFGSLQDQLAASLLHSSSPDDPDDELLGTIPAGSLADGTVVLTKHSNIPLCQALLHAVYSTAVPPGSSGSGTPLENSIRHGMFLLGLCNMRRLYVDLTLTEGHRARVLLQGVLAAKLRAEAEGQAHTGGSDVSIASPELH
eukprot:gene817-2547_t